MKQTYKKSTNLYYIFLN